MSVPITDDILKVKTTKEVFDAIFAAHSSLTVFSTYTKDPENYDTAWGFMQADYPLMFERRRDGVHKYYLYVIKESDE